MKTRTQRTLSEQEQPLFNDMESTLDLEALSDEDIEAMLFDEERSESSGIWNLPTISGLSLIFVGILYIFQEMGIWNGFDLSFWVSSLPWLAGILIILLGFGVLSWRPRRRQKKVKKGYDAVTGEKVVMEKTKPKRKSKLMRSRDKKVAGVCGGVAEYFGLDPTLVRIAFVIGIIASGGPFLLAYIALAFVLPKPDPLPLEERITIIRDT